MTIVDDILHTSLKIKTPEGKNIPIDFIDIFYIHEATIDQDYAQQAAIFAYFSTVQAGMEKALNDVKKEVEELYAEGDLDYRAQMDQEGEKYTEGKVKANILLDEDYSKKRDEQIRLEYDVAFIKAVVNALKMRAEMLVSLGANMRQEYGQTDMRLRQLDEATKEVKRTLKSRRKQV
jgi:hypothetical protein